MTIAPVAAFGRLGTESAFDVLARATRLAMEGRSIINLGIGQPDFPTPPHIVEAAVKALRDGAHGYTPAAGILPLREAVAADIAARRGVAVDPARILIVPGGKVTMAFAIMMLGEPGAEIAYPDPGFPIYESLIRFSGATPVPVPLLEKDGFAFDPELLLEKLTPRTRLVIINSPGNPTGGVAGRAALDRLVAGLARFPDAAILSDEIYGRLSFDEPAGDEPSGQRGQAPGLLPYGELADRLILLDGWSKTYAMTGWRLGYGVWPKALAPVAERFAINLHSCVNAATQHAGIAALIGPQDAVDTMRSAFAERRQVVVDGLNRLPGIRCVMPRGAFYAFANISGTGMTAKQLETELLEDQGVATIAGTSFGRQGEGFLRLSYANSLDNIRTALARMQTFLAARRG